MNISRNNLNNLHLKEKVKPAAKFVVNKSWALAKKVIPGIFMMTCSFTIGHMMNSGKNRPIDPRMDANWAYHAGEQRIRDSLKIVELEQKIAADSMKIYHLSKKAGLDKAIKK